MDRRTLHERVVKFLISKKCPKQLAEDIASDTIERTMNATIKSSLFGYACKVAIRMFWTEVKRQRGFLDDEGLEKIGVDPVVSFEILNEDMLEYQVAKYLAVWQDFSNRSIALEIALGADNKALYLKFPLIPGSSLRKMRSNLIQRVRLASLLGEMLLTDEQKIAAFLESKKRFIEQHKPH